MGRGPEDLPISTIQLLAALDAPAIVYDLEGRFTYANGVAERILQHSLAELAGRLALEVAPGLRGAWAEAFARLAAGDSTFERLELYDAVWHAWYENRMFRTGDAVLVLLRDTSSERRMRTTRDRLMELVETLSGASTRQEMVRSVLTAGIELLGADSASVALPDADGTHLEVIDSVGFSAERTAAYRRVPIELRTPGNDVFRTGEPLWFDSPAQVEVAYPHLADQTRHHPPEAYAILPLRTAERTYGLLFFGFRGGRDFTDEARALQLTLARHCALVLERVRLREAEAAALHARERQAHRARAIAEASRAFTEVLAARGGTKDICELLVSRVLMLFSSGCAVRLVKNGLFEAVAVRTPPDVDRARIERVLALPQRIDEGFSGECLRDNHTLLVDDLEARIAAMAPSQRMALGAPDPVSLLATPLRVAGRPVGVVLLTRKRGGAERGFSPDDVEIVEELVERAGLAISAVKAHEDLEHAYARAEEASRAKDEFLAMLGHELRNPLAPIVTALQLMAQRSPDAAPAERAIIERQVRHLTLLIDDLLDVSRITRGLVQLRREPVEIARVVANAIERVSPLLEEQNHFLDFAVPSRGLVVLGDEARLTQVLTNVLANAARYTSPGGCIRVVASVTGEHVQLSVQDNGMGIERDLLPRIFDLFVQGRRALDRRGGGLGLGLAVVRRLIELHGGTVEAFSDGPGRGTELRIRLPRAAEAMVDGTISASTLLGEPPPPVEARGTRVLIVDDNEDAGVILGEALRRHGYEVALAADGPMALRLAAETPPQVVLLDIGLPVMDGYEVARRLRAQLQPAKVKLVAVTGYGRDSDRLKTRAAGFDLHLTKPVDLDVVLGALVRL